MQPFANSLVVTLTAPLISIVLGTLAAYGPSQFSFKFLWMRDADITFLFISQRIMPPIVLATPFFFHAAVVGSAGQPAGPDTGLRCAADADCGLGHFGFFQR